jgi:outer membrane protein assembly factor BamB
VPKDDQEKKAELKEKLDGIEKESRALMNKYPIPPEVYGDQGSTNSGATPTCDGKHLYVMFGNGIVCSYSVTGEKRWARFIEASFINFGHAASPVLVDGKVLVHYNDLVALDAKTGEEVWRTPLTARHATSVPALVGDTRVVIHPAGAVVRVSDGKVLLKSDLVSNSECTPLVHDGTIYTTHGRARALKLVPAGADAVKIEKVWEGKLTGGRRTPSSVLHQGRLYALTTDGKMDVLDAKTGAAIYDHRFSIHECYTSVTVAGKYLFVGCTRGTAIFFEPGDEYKEVTRNEIDGFGSTPVFQGERMYLRTRQWMYCVGR